MLKLDTQTVTCNNPYQNYPHVYQPTKNPYDRIQAQAYIRNIMVIVQGLVEKNTQQLNRPSEKQTDRQNYILPYS